MHVILRKSVIQKSILCGGLALSVLAPFAGACAKSGDTVLYDFKGKSDGANPSGILYADGTGNFYGTAALGGSGSGVIFKLTSKGAESAFYTFTGGSGGAYPGGGLVAEFGRQLLRHDRHGRRD